MAYVVLVDYPNGLSVNDSVTVKVNIAILGPHIGDRLHIGGQEGKALNNGYGFFYSNHEAQQGLVKNTIAYKHEPHLMKGSIGHARLDVG